VGQDALHGTHHAVHHLALGVAVDRMHAAVFLAHGLMHAVHVLHHLRHVIQHHVHVLHHLALVHRSHLIHHAVVILAPAVFVLAQDGAGDEDHPGDGDENDQGLHPP
jgi:hypothetical protein